MRNFVISLICILVLMAAWASFSVYSAQTSSEIQLLFDELITHSINDNDWPAVENNYEQLSKAWHRYKIPASFFLDLNDINEIDCTLAKARLYVEAEDASNASGEFSYLKHQFQLLHENDSLLLHNIF